MTEPPIRVVVADDQNAVRQGLVALLSTMPGMSVVGEAGDGRDAVRLALLRHADVVLMDARMPGSDGIHATRQLTQRRPSVAVLMLTTYDDEGTVFAALRAGARGVLTKDATAHDIEAAITAVHASDASQERLAPPRVPARSSARSTPAPGGLTARELAVLELIASGHNNAEIAAELVIAEATVKTHVNNIFAKLDVRDRSHAIVWAYAHGLMGIPPGAGR